MEAGAATSQDASADTTLASEPGSTAAVQGEMDRTIAGLCGSSSKLVGSLLGTAWTLAVARVHAVVHEAVTKAWH
jgi:hypothetical protein